jgi:archaeal flagellar protein FlaJ
MREQNPVLLLFPLDKARHFSNKFLFIGRFLTKIIFSLKYDLDKAEIDIQPENYCLASFISAMIYGLMFLFVGAAFGIIIIREISAFTFLLMFGFGMLAFIGSLIFHLLYPKIAAAQLAALVDQELLFALRTLLIQLSSGISLFEAMHSITKGDYGQVSHEFEQVVRDINTGHSESSALEKLAFRTKSEILKKSVWQIITTMKSGGSIVTALNAEVDSLNAQQVEVIKNYSAELNLWTLIYLIIAAAMPSLGITFLVIASSIGGSGIGVEAVMLIALLAACIQVAMIFMIKTKVPKVIK